MKKCKKLFSMHNRICACTRKSLQITGYSNILLGFIPVHSGKFQGSTMKYIIDASLHNPLLNHHSTFAMTTVYKINGGRRGGEERERERERGVLCKGGGG
jgi:hypothetical protein